MKKKMLFVCAAAAAVAVTGCCCGNQPECFEEETVIIATPAQPQKKGKCKQKMQDKKACPASGKTVANNIAGCGNDQGNCPVPSPSPAPAPTAE